jgi:predicted nucleic acid-binding protein
VSAGTAVASWINVGEVYYLRARQAGHTHAAAAVAALRAQLEVEQPDPELVLDAARIKADHRVSYADGFAVATAERHAFPLVTGDRELLALDRRLRVIDPRI